MQERGPVAAVAQALTRRRAAALAGLVSAVVAVDQLTKTLAERGLDDGPVHLFWTIYLRLTYNSGAAFSSGRGLTPIITALVVIVLIVLVGLARSVTTRLGLVALGLLIGGATGNLIDRLLRDNDGAVIDFIDMSWWPVWNVADAAVVIGAALLILSQRGQKPEPGDGD